MKMPYSQIDERFRMSLGPLPKITLRDEVTGQMFGFDDGKYIDYFASGNGGYRYSVGVNGLGTIGSVSLSNAMFGTWTHIELVTRFGPDRKETKGGMLATYILTAAQCESQGRRLRSGMPLTTGSINIWNILVGAGLAEIKKDFKPLHRLGGPYYKGAAFMKLSSELPSRDDVVITY